MSWAIAIGNISTAPARPAVAVLPKPEPAPRVPLYTAHGCRLTAALTDEWSTSAEICKRANVVSNTHSHTKLNELAKAGIAQKRMLASNNKCQFRRAPK